jgi:hypothetical protein
MQQRGRNRAEEQNTTRIKSISSKRERRRRKKY